MRSFRSCVALVVVVLALPAASAQALEDFVNRVPNPLRVGGQGCITCHNNPDGGQGCGDGTPYPEVTSCFNMFGQAFSANGRVWDETLAQLDSDGDGFTNGQELQDPLGEWRFLLSPPTPGTPSCVSAPGFADIPSLPVGVNLPTDPGADADSDGFCCIGQDTNRDGDCRTTAEHTGALAAVSDCDDGEPAIRPDATEQCLGSIDTDCDGDPGIEDSECGHLVDNDGDGFCEVGHRVDDTDPYCLGPEETGDPVDCNDQAATVFPGAAESCFDGLDNDCDDKADLEDEACSAAVAFSDQDGDGFCPLGRDLSVPLDGDCVDDGEDTQPFDCDDALSTISPLAAENCRDGADNDCNGAADLEDPTCASLVDNDGDGFCPAGRDLSSPLDGDCADDGEEGGTALDCDDDDPLSYPGAQEICIDDADNDCDGEASITDSDCTRFVDFDGDGFCSEGWDLDDDGDCNGELEPAGPGDCNDDDPLVNPGQAEICTDAVDNDCDGRTDGSDRADCGALVDQDGDGYCEQGRDLNGDGDCGDGAEPDLPSDCDTEDATRYPGAPEVCFDGLDNDCNGVIDLDDVQCALEGAGRIDADGDGYCPVGVDHNGDGDCADEDEGEKVKSDCNDRNPAVHFGAEELCDDAVDNDCDFLVDLDDLVAGSGIVDTSTCARVLDQDGDSFCPMGRDRNGDGDCLDATEVAPASDCDDLNVRAFPGFAEVCDDGFDNDCDGDVDFADSECVCEADSDCDDGDDCTTDRCAGGECTHAPSCGPMDGDAGVADAGESSEDAGSEDDPPETTVDAAEAGTEPEASGPIRLNNGCSLGRGQRSRGASLLFVGFGLALFAARRRERRR